MIGKLSPNAIIEMMRNSKVDSVGKDGTPGGFNGENIYIHPLYNTKA